MKKIIFYLTILSFISIQSQEVAFTVGTNYTDYSFDANDDFEATGMGSHFEIGYTKKIGKTKTEKSLGYSLSLNLNQYNASYGNMASSYSLEKYIQSTPKPPVASIIVSPETIFDLNSAVFSEEVCSMFTLFGK